MSKLEILAELALLDPRDRREIARRVFDLEGDAQMLTDCDRRADEHFLMLDALDPQTKPHGCNPRLFPA
jgi:hypothetical protein